MAQAPRFREDNPMKARWRLGLNVALWACVIPIDTLFTKMAAYLRSETLLELSESIGRSGIASAIHLAWAGLIYWYCVPRTPRLAQRVAYLLVFCAGMLGALALALLLSLAINRAIAVG
ncbi:hypothetical protein [Variovorax sp. GB1P17]|uniref:hypothetical protein n=1 Tax=Variovorax sp. GB1P17 TaxID=3443740 RepID=UPI003F48563B